MSYGAQHYIFIYIEPFWLQSPVEQTDTRKDGQTYRGAELL